MQPTASAPLAELAGWLAAADAGADVAGTALFDLPATHPPWRATGLRVRAGQAYSVFAAGRVRWSASNPALYGGPRFHLWLRVVPGGRIRNLRDDTDSFVADVDGEVEAAVYMGVWRDASGALATGAEPYARLAGGLQALVVAWHGTALRGVGALAARSRHPLAVAEATHLAAEPVAPAGWRPLLETGESRLFTAGRAADGAPLILVHGEDDQGILCRDADFPLEPGTRLTWSWRLAEHPSPVAEDRAPSHDYVSIATEFDDGRDLTWFWSSCLPPGTHFACPVRAWSARETHFVVRSGAAGLGAWQRETRAVWHDVASTLDTPPRRIVRVWLIALASFQHGRLAAAFGDIRLTAPGRVLQVL